MNKAFFFLLFALQCCFAQQPDLFFWLELRGTRAQVLEQLYQNRTEWDTLKTDSTFAPKSPCSAKITILTQGLDTFVLGFTQDTLSSIVLRFEENIKVLYNLNHSTDYINFNNFKHYDTYSTQNEYTLTLIQNLPKLEFRPEAGEIDCGTQYIPPDSIWLSIAREKDFYGCVHTEIRWRNHHFAHCR